MLIDNIKFLKKNYPDIYKKLEQIDSKKYNDISIEEAKNKNRTIKYIGENKSIYIHSKYNPSEEAYKLVDDFLESEGNANHIIVYGVGLGHHILELADKYPNSVITLIEPSIEILHAFLCEFDLNKILLGDIFVENENYISSLIDKIIINNKNCDNKIFTLNSYKNIFEDNYGIFLSKFNDAIKHRRSQLEVNYNFQKRWIINSMKNFSTTLNTKNILLQDRSVYDGKIALIVSAGPSLEDEIENLKEIKRNKSAYIFSVGSSISTLYKNNVLPDAVCTYDPTIENAMVHDILVRNNIDTIPMIYGTSVGYESLENYKGPKLHMITSQDMISQFYIQSKSKKQIEGVIDSPSIAVITLQLLYRLGFSKIIFVGQNLAYRNNKNYADDIEYIDNIVSEEIKVNSIRVRSVDGDLIETDFGFNQMRQQIEFYISQFENVDILNSTKGGAHIEGSRYMNLKDIINTYLISPIVDEEWYLKDEKDSYDIEHLYERNLLMNKSYEEIKDVLREIQEINKKIFDLARNKNFKQVETMYNKLDFSFGKLWNNIFYNMVLKPMHRVEYELLGNEVNLLKKEINPIKKAEGMVNQVEKFVQRCYQDYDILIDPFIEMQSAITKKIDESKDNLR